MAERQNDADPNPAQQAAQTWCQQFGDMIRGMTPVKGEAIGHIELFERELAPHLGAGVPEVDELKTVLTGKRAELEANQTAAGERILDRISTINVADESSDPTVELKYFYDEWKGDWLGFAVPDAKNVRGRIEKAKTDKEGEIAKAAEKAKAEEAAQPAPAGEGAQGGGAPGGEPEHRRGEGHSLRLESQRRQLCE